MYLNKKGKVPNQAHVGIPEGLCEEEHGREGFTGPVSHLYRTHPPTGWVKIDGPLKPRAFGLSPSVAEIPEKNYEWKAYCHLLGHKAQCPKS